MGLWYVLVVLSREGLAERGTDGFYGWYGWVENGNALVLGEFPPLGIRHLSKEMVMSGMGGTGLAESGTDGFYVGYGWLLYARMLCE